VTRHLARGFVYIWLRWRDRQLNQKYDAAVNDNAVIQQTTTKSNIEAPIGIFTMPRVAQQPRASNGRNVSGSMAASPFKSPVKYVINYCSYDSGI
jgi:hypothetical protein